MFPMITVASALSRLFFTPGQNSQSASGLEHFLSGAITPLTNLAVNKIEWKNNSIANHKQIEANFARLACESPAAHKTVDALLATLTKLFILVEKDELRATTNMLRSYVSDTPNFSVVGQLGAGGFSRIMAEARHGGALPLRNGQEALTLREKATAFYNLINSTYFRETMEQIHGSPALQELAAGLVDTRYLGSKQFSS